MVMKKIVYVAWMDCIACETVLHDALEKIKTIKVVSITHKTGKMTIEYASEKDLTTLRTILKEHNYSLQEERWNQDQSVSIYTRVEQAVIAFWILSFLRAFTKLDLMQYVGDYSQPTMSFGVAFLVWLVACGSSCLAVTGWIVVSYVESLENKGWLSMFKIQALFHLGRLVAFVGWWALLGYIGQSFQISPSVNGGIMILVWLILSYVGLQIFGIVPSITKRWFHLPWWIDKVIKKLQHPNYGVIVGFLTFFLPCWFTQSMQLLAMQSGSATQGSMILWAYALGTIPLLLWLWLSAGYFKEKLASFNKIVAILLVVFWLVTVSNGYTLVSLMSASQSSQNPSKQVAVSVEKLARQHQWNTLYPHSIAAEVNKSYEITINPTKNGLWCKSTIYLPNGTSYPVRQNTPITFAFNPTQPGTYTLKCPMGSAHGSIVVK